MSIIGINLQQPSLSLGCLDIIGSSAGTHGHGEAPGDAPTRENDKNGRSSNLTLLESLYLQSVFALGRALKRVSSLEVWAVWWDFYMRTIGGCCMPTRAHGGQWTLMGSAHVVHSLGFTLFLWQ